MSEFEPLYWIDRSRSEIRAQLGPPGWGGDDQDSWLSRGISCWYDGNERIREISLGIMFATPKGKPLSRFQGEFLGLRLGAPLPTAMRPTLSLHSQDLQSEIHAMRIADHLLQVEVWNQPYADRGENFLAGTIRGIRLIRGHPGPARGKPPAVEGLILCVFCCQPLPPGPDCCDHCHEEVGEERMEMRPEELEKAERKTCSNCHQVVPAMAFRCGFCAFNFSAS